MSESQNSLRQRREYPSKGPEERVLREIASCLLMLDTVALRILHRHGNHSDLKSFQQVTKTHLDSIGHDGLPESIPFENIVKRYVRTVSRETLDQIVSNPVDSEYYRLAIYLQMSACEDAKREEEQAKYLGDKPSGVEELAREELLDIVNISRHLYKHVKDAASRGYLKKNIALLKAKLQSIDENIEDACKYLGFPHLPQLVFTDSADQRERPRSSLHNPPDASITQGKARSALAFIVPVICALSAIPACFAWSHAENKPGKVTDSDFFQLLASAQIQLLGICTALWPIINNLRPDRAAWIQAWTLATISVCFTVAAVPLYLLAPASLSGISLLAGSLAQSLLQLQLVLGIPRHKTHED